MLLNKTLQHFFLPVIVGLVFFGVFGTTGAQQIEQRQLIHPQASSYSVDWDNQITSYINTLTNSSVGWHDDSADTIFIEDFYIDKDRGHAEGWLTVTYKMQRGGSEYIELENIFVPGIWLRKDQCTEGYLRDYFRGRTVKVDLYTKYNEPIFIIEDPDESVEWWGGGESIIFDLAEWLVKNGFAYPVRVTFGEGYARPAPTMLVSDLNKLAFNVSGDYLQPVHEMAQFNETGLWWQYCQGQSEIVDSNQDVNSENIGMFIGTIGAMLFITLVFYLIGVRFASTADGRSNLWLYNVAIYGSAVCIIVFNFIPVPEFIMQLAIAVTFSGGILIIRYGKAYKWVGTIAIIIAVWHLLAFAFVGSYIVI